MKQIDALAIGNEVPNLDAFTDSEQLAECRAEFKLIAEAFKQLASYAEAKQHAMQCRKSGKIELARKFENACDTVYKQIPQGFRW